MQLLLVQAACSYLAGDPVPAPHQMTVPSLGHGCAAACWLSTGGRLQLMTGYTASTCACRHGNMFMPACLSILVMCITPVHAFAMQLQLQQPMPWLLSCAASGV